MPEPSAATQPSLPPISTLGQASTAAHAPVSSSSSLESSLTSLEWLANISTILSSAVAKPIASNNSSSQELVATPAVAPVPAQESSQAQLDLSNSSAAALLNAASQITLEHNNQAIPNDGNNNNLPNNNSVEMNIISQTMPEVDAIIRKMKAELVGKDPNERPNYSYSTLIALAIRKSLTGRLTLTDIYNWISENFPYYQTDLNPSWKNSVRHNLSFNKLFMRIPREHGDPGKGAYWGINPNAANANKIKARRSSGVKRKSVSSDSERPTKTLQPALNPSGQQQFQPHFNNNSSLFMFQDANAAPYYPQLQNQQHHQYLPGINELGSMSGSLYNYAVQQQMPAGMDPNYKISSSNVYNAPMMQNNNFAFQNMPPQQQIQGHQSLNSGLFSNFANLMYSANGTASISALLQQQQQPRLQSSHSEQQLMPLLAVQPSGITAANNLPLKSTAVVSDDEETFDYEKII